MMKISFFSRIKKFAVNARKKSKGITLGEFTRSYADERRKEGEKIYEGRCGSVLGMLKHLETFGGSDIPLKKVDVETVKQFIDYLRSAHDLHKNMKAPGKLSAGRGSQSRQCRGQMDDRSGRRLPDTSVPRRWCRSTH